MTRPILLLAPVLILPAVSPEAQAQTTPPTRPRIAPEVAPTSRPSEETAFVAPRTSTERSLARLWRDVLRVERVGVRDRFCALGGHSLTATQIVLRIESSFGVRIDPGLVLGNPSLEELALAIDQQRVRR